MIVLDEQLLGRLLEFKIATWYPGTVQISFSRFRPESKIVRSPRFILDV
jgi:hypothetical protein